MKKIFIILLVAIATNCYSQKDVYYLKNNGDTVFCKKLDCWFVGTPPLTMKFKFDASPLDKKVESVGLNDITEFQGFFSPDNHSRNAIKSYNVLTKFEVYLLKEISPKNPIPLRLVAEENGKKLFVNLYPINQRVTYKYYYKDGNSIVELNKKNYNEKLKIIFSNFKEVMEQLNNGKNYIIYDSRIKELVDVYYKSINKKFIHEK